jgi:glutamate racemase
MRASWYLTVVGTVALGIAPAHAQPPIHGVTGTMATEATIKSEHKAANKLVVATEDGVEHVYDAAKGLVVHGGKDPLSDLRPGTTVIVH